MDFKGAINAIIIFLIVALFLYMVVMYSNGANVITYAIIILAVFAFGIFNKKKTEP